MHKRDCKTLQFIFIRLCIKKNHSNYFEEKNPTWNCVFKRNMFILRLHFKLENVFALKKNEKIFWNCTTYLCVSVSIDRGSCTLELLLKRRGTRCMLSIEKKVFLVRYNSSRGPWCLGTGNLILEFFFFVGLSNISDLLLRLVGKS